VAGAPGLGPALLADLIRSAGDGVASGPGGDDESAELGYETHQASRQHPA